MTLPDGSPPVVDPDLSALDVGQVEEVLRALAAALRSYRLYEGGNPMLEKFITNLQQRLAGLWQELPQLRLDIEEDRIIWEGQIVFPTGESSSDLPFLFYKDGIRELTLLPGFEAEVPALLRVLARAPSLKGDEDDLITLLWQEDMANLRYQAVEAGAEGVEGIAAGQPSPGSVNAAAVRQEGANRDTLTADDFQETLYFLDEAELRKLRNEVRQESERDLWKDVLCALLDRLEDGSEERQVRIVCILAELLPSALGSAEFGRAASLLRQMVEVASKRGVLKPPAMRQIRGLFDILGTDEMIVQLAEILEEMPERLNDPSVLELLGYFPPRSIGSLMRAADRLERPDVRRAFEGCIQRLAEGNREEVLNLLQTDDPSLLVGALKWVGRLEIGAALNDVLRFLKHPDAGVRIAAVEALVSLRGAVAGNGLIPLLEDGSREVRVAAARALGTLVFAQARSALENAIGSKRLREADRNEKIAFFEAYGRICGPEGVPVLDKILNTKSWLGRGESPELRACAALALAKVRHPSAREALNSAAGDTDPVVRTAVARAIRGEAG